MRPRFCVSQGYQHPVNTDSLTFFVLDPLWDATGDIVAALDDKSAAAFAVATRGFPAYLIFNRKWNRHQSKLLAEQQAEASEQTGATDPPVHTPRRRQRSLSEQTHTTRGPSPRTEGEPEPELSP